MKEGDRPEAPDILLLSGSGTVCDGYMTDLQRKLELFNETIINDWTRSINRGDYANITSFFSKHGDISWGFIITLNSYLPELIRLRVPI